MWFPKITRTRFKTFLNLAAFIAKLVWKLTRIKEFVPIVVLHLLG